MKVLKLVLISVIAFFLLMLAFSLLIPSHIRVSRAIHIEGERQKLIPLINSVAGWEQWNSLAASKTGSLSISSVSDSLVKTVFKTKNQSIDNGLAVYEIRPGTLTVQWYIDFHLPWYPWEKFGGILYDKQFGPVMEQDLKKLSQLVNSSIHQ